jgi:hypothetical protein
MKMSNVNYDTETLVNEYLTIRDNRARILREFESQDAKLKEDLGVIERQLIDVCNTINADSIKTRNGTVMRKLTERFYCEDWDGFKQFVLDNEAVDLFEKRIHQGNFKQFMNDHEGQGLPPGVNVMREFGITVRKVNAV